MAGMFFNLAYSNLTEIETISQFSFLMDPEDQNPGGIKIMPFFENQLLPPKTAEIKEETFMNTISFARRFQVNKLPLIFFSQMRFEKN
jgi:hypothetical protein